MLVLGYKHLQINCLTSSYQPFQSLFREQFSCLKLTIIISNKPTQFDVIFECASTEVF